MTVSAHDAALDVLDRADALLLLDAPGRASSVREDIRRMSLAMGLAAIDTQMHWLISKVDLSGSIPDALGNLTVNFADLLKADHAAVAARANKTKHRPATASRRVLMSAISWRTFQRSGKLSDGLAMLGIKLDDVARAMVPPEPLKDVRQHIDRLADRRNAIVHEGDITIMQRPHILKRAAITGVFARGELAWIRRFLSSLRSLT